MNHNRTDLHYDGIQFHFNVYHSRTCPTTLILHKGQLVTRQCTNGITHTQHTQYTTILIINPSFVFAADICNSNSTEPLAHPSDCRQYIQCTDDYMYVQRCSQSLCFNPATLQCDLPEPTENVPGRKSLLLACIIESFHRGFPLKYIWIHIAYLIMCIQQPHHLTFIGNTLCLFHFILPHGNC